MITLLETIGMGTLLICDQPLRQHPRKVIRSIRSKYRSSHNNKQQYSHSNKTIAIIICTHQGFQQPITNATTVSGATPATSTLTPAGTASAFCTNLKFRIPHLPLQCLQRMVMGNIHQQQGSSIFSCTSTVSLRNQ